jgi:hypothetical protein
MQLGPVVRKGVPTYTLGVIYTVGRMPFSREKYGLENFESLCKQIESLYLSGMSLKQVGKELGHKPQTIWLWLKERGVQTRTSKQAAVFAPKRSAVHDFNQNAFDEINTEETAYWLGFILADGCVRSRGNSFAVNLKQSDYQHLVKLKTFLDASHRVSFHKQGDYYERNSSFSVTGKHFCEKLRSLGIVAGAKQPYRVSRDLEAHYWRGVIDGDGCIVRSRVYRNGVFVDKHYLAISLVGTKETMALFEDFCQRRIGCKAGFHKAKNIYYYRVHGLQAVDLGLILYKRSSVFLSRKLQKFRDIVKEVEWSLGELRTKYICEDLDSLIAGSAI